MANFEKKNDLSEKPKPSFFNRSLTLHPVAQKPFFNQSLDRAASMKKLYKDSCESVLTVSNSFKGKVKHLCNVFESTKSPSSRSNEFSLLSSPKLKAQKSMGTNSRLTSNAHNTRFIRLPGTEDRIVVYVTSLRGIRRTFEDCYSVRMIFRGFNVWVDERDVSMDSAYKKELQSVLGEKNLSLPRVFIRGKYMGGVDMIKHLFEVGELAKLLDEFPSRKPGFVCENCGDMRFVPCTNCSGSRKVFDEVEELQKRCFKCNENGLIRCLDCCF